VRLQLHWGSLPPRSKVRNDVVQYTAPLKKAWVRGERAGTVRLRNENRGVWELDELTRLHAATPTENETCGNFGGLIAWYGNLIGRQTIRYAHTYMPEGNIPQLAKISLSCHFLFWLKGRRTNQILRYHIEVTYPPGREGKGVIFEGVHNLSLIDEYRKVTNTIGNLQLRTRVLFPKDGRPNRSSKLGSTFSILDFRNESLKELWKRYFLRIQCGCNFFEKVRAKISQDNPELSHYSMFRIKIVLASMKGQRNTRGQIVIMNEMVHV